MLPQRRHRLVEPGRGARSRRQLESAGAPSVRYDSGERERSMRARAFWKAVTLDRADFLDRLIALLTEHDIRFCVVGGQEVIAYAEHVESLDLDLYVAVVLLACAVALLLEDFTVDRCANSTYF